MYLVFIIVHFVELYIIIMLWHVIRLLINNRHVIINRHSVDYLKNVVNTTFCPNMQVGTCVANITLNFIYYVVNTTLC